MSSDLISSKLNHSDPVTNTVSDSQTEQTFTESQSKFTMNPNLDVANQISPSVHALMHVMMIN